MRRARHARAVHKAAAGTATARVGVVLAVGVSTGRATAKGRAPVMVRVDARIKLVRHIGAVRAVGGRRRTTEVVRPVPVRVDARVRRVGETAVVWAVSALGVRSGGVGLVRVDGIHDLVDDGRHVGYFAVVFDELSSGR